MPQSAQLLPPQAAMAIDQRIEDQDKQLYRILYISRVHPDDSDVNKVVMFQCTVHLFAFDANEAYALFSNNVPEHYPVAILISCAPVQPDIPLDSLLEIARGPRAIN